MNGRGFDWGSGEVRLCRVSCCPTIQQVGKGFAGVDPAQLTATQLITPLSRGSVVAFFSCLNMQVSQRSCDIVF